MSKYVIKRIEDISGVPCPCGEAFRILTGEDNDTLSVHVVNISKDSKPHYHKRLSETYYVIEGEGEIELDGIRKRIEPGTVIYIPPGTVHRAIGNLKILNIVVPPFDPEDEHQVS